MIIWLSYLWWTLWEINIGNPDAAKATFATLSTFEIMAEIMFLGVLIINYLERRRK